MADLILSKTNWVSYREITIPSLLAGLLFLTVVSSSLRSLLFPITALCMLSIPSIRSQLGRMARHPVSQSLFLLFTWIIVASIWSPASWKQAFVLTEKYSKLLYLPLLAIGFQNAKTRSWALYAYLAGVLFTVIVLLTNKYGITNLRDSTQSGVFYNHIVTGTLLAFGSWLAFFLASKKEGMNRLLFIALGCLVSYAVLFINTSRTGYILYMVLMLILFKQLLSLRQTVLISVLFSAIIMGCFYSSTVMHDGLQTVINNLQSYNQENKDTSIGYRVQFHLYAKSLFIKHPLSGNGTGALTWNYLQDDPVPNWKVRYFDPHSQYWLFAVEQGIIGLILLGVFLLSLLKLSFKAIGHGPILFAFLLLFTLGCFSDSLLLVSPTGWFLLLFSALCLGEVTEAGKNDV